MKKITVLLISLLLVQACNKEPRPIEPQPSPSPTVAVTPTVTPEASPSATPGVLFVMGKDVGYNVNKKFAQDALDIMNKHVASGCLKQKFMLRSLTSLKNVEGPELKTKEAAIDTFISGGPYALDLRWYAKRYSSVIGYTFNWLDGLDEDRCYNKATPVCPTETKIYSNTNIIFGYTPGDYGAHLTHETSHQARARGFVHWTVFDGSFPYEVGYAMDDCVNQPTGKSLRNEQRLPSAFRRTMEAHKRHEMKLHKAN